MSQYEKRFWMVLGAETPTFRHVEIDTAIKEAERLANANPGKEFIVLESVAACRRQTVAWAKHVVDPNYPEMERDGDGVPF
jgi:hypothetical protein